MKKLFVVIGAVMLALAVGVAYAADRDWGLSNGVTVFEANPEPTIVEGPGLALENGITVIEPVISTARVLDYSESGSATGGMAEEKLSNGVTVFDAAAAGSMYQNGQVE